MVVLNTKSLLTIISNVLPLRLKKNFPPMIRTCTELEGIKSKLPFKTFSTLTHLLISFSRDMVMKLYIYFVGFNTTSSVKFFEVTVQIFVYKLLFTIAFNSLIDFVF